MQGQVQVIGDRHGGDSTSALRAAPLRCGYQTGRAELTAYDPDLIIADL
ncbi:hypothetical protein GCM10020366_51310 [Saccharopolyspora gregorii]|uniref:Uncharacterized protein n=1 Tax=Saccharopolyspora gregorii TaxID=33914 RepID=A0ABP6RXC3_9PSEU